MVKVILAIIALIMFLLNVYVVSKSTDIKHLRSTAILWILVSMIYFIVDILSQIDIN